ncbi:hypothetical protein [Dactylosporangium sp. CA-139066]|uniref:hypothetical protein n=1 Tax=Dactylosporangium sp. CA-139066 TaxID=3239930 RepID=UPI003D8A85F1
MKLTPRFTVPRDDRRDCALYRVMVLHPATGRVVLGYIGETARQPFVRFLEHLYDQPWGDTIVGHPHVDPRVFCGKTDVMAAEESAVLAEKPLYNIEYQKGAPHAIPQWTAREQRAERDRRRGVVSPDWAAKDTVGPAGWPPKVVARPVGLSPAWRRFRNWSAGLGAGWLAVTLLLWWADAVTVAVDVPGRTYPIGGLLAAALVPAWRVRRRRDRRMVVAVVTVACAALWLVTG